MRATLDCLCVLIVTAALYACFGEHQGQGTASRALAAVLFFLPLVGGVVLGLRGHVPPIAIHVTCGVANAVAAVFPLTVIGAEPGELLRVSWLSVPQVASLLGLVALGAGLSSLGGAELGGIIAEALRTVRGARDADRLRAP